MTLVLRKQRAEDRIEGREPPPDWSHNDYAVVDEKVVGGRRKMISSGCGFWRYQRLPQSIATLEETTAALTAQYEQVKRGEWWRIGRASL
jgi:hypothetical protein